MRNVKHLVGVVRRIKIFFWRLPKELRGDIRYGQNQWQVRPWYHFIHPQRVAIYDKVAAKESGKLAKVGRRGYVSVLEVNILTRYFLVPKVEDISMVYNGTYSGLTSSLSMKFNKISPVS